MRTKYIFTNRNGSAMLLGLLAVMLLSALGLALLSAGMSSVITAKRDFLRMRALEVADAGVETGISWLRGMAPNGSTDGSYRNQSPSNPTDYSGGDTVTIGPGETVKICLRTAAGGDPDRVVITAISTVTHGGATASRTVAVLVERRAENVSPWNNVIFGGVGQSGKSINGNVVFRGSVHLLGDGETFTDTDRDGRWDDHEFYWDSNRNGQYDAGEPYVDTDRDGHRDAREPFNDINGNGTRDPALTVTDLAEEMSGNANIGNSYESTPGSATAMPAALRAKVPSPPTKIIDGLNVQSLSAKLRVKHGRVNVSGSATVGDVNVSANSVKEMLDGAFVSDGYGGTRGSSSVYADNGSNHGYDLGDGLVEFPALTDPCPPYSTYQDYLKATSLNINGALSITPGEAFSISDASGKNSISYDGNGNLSITGKVFVTGDIVLDRTNGCPTLTYNGQGTLVSTGDVSIHCNVLPRTGFPLTDRLGLIAAHNTWIATGSGDSNLTMAMACYSQYKVTVGKQCEIAGSLVTSYFDMKNVPHLYQVPALANNLPPGMPGSDPIYIITVAIKSWQDKAGSGWEEKPDSSR